MTTPNQNTPAIQEKTITDQVLARINQFQEAKALTLPSDYSAENALKSAYLMLQGADSRPLEVCTKDSITIALLDMVVQGLSPAKNQCYFIPYGNKLKLSRSYFGSVAVAKRMGMKEVVANVIYEGDDFVYEIIPETGRKRLVRHLQNWENIDNDKIKGAYAITEMQDGTFELTIMNMAQIKKAWEQGKTNGASPAHKNFRDEMCKKTVVQRACKYITNTASDGYLKVTKDIDEEPSPLEQANTVEIGFEEVHPESPEATATEPAPAVTIVNAPEAKDIKAPSPSANGSKKGAQQAEMFQANPDF